MESGLKKKAMITRSSGISTCSCHQGRCTKNGRRQAKRCSLSHRIRKRCGRGSSYKDTRVRNKLRVTGTGAR